MKCPSVISALLLVLALASHVLTIPIQSHQADPDFQVSFSQSTERNQDLDVQATLYKGAAELNRGEPDEWRKLIFPPQMTPRSNAAIYVIALANLESVMKTWDLDSDVFLDVHENTRGMIQESIEQGWMTTGMYLFKRRSLISNTTDFSCTTVVVSFRVMPHNLNTEPGNVKIQLGHFFADSVAVATPLPKCHPSWEGTTCHDSDVPRDLQGEEFLVVDAVMSTQQSHWVMQNIPSQQGGWRDALYTGLFSDPTAPILPSNEGIDGLLRRFLNNAAENQEVYKHHTNNILIAIQNATHLNRQNFRSMSRISIHGWEVLSVLNNMLTNCFKQADLEESVVQWWSRVSGDDNPEQPRLPVSLECDISTRVIKPIKPPHSECLFGKRVTISTGYSWYLIMAQDNTDLIDIISIEGDLDVTYDECSLTDDNRDTYSATERDVYEEIMGGISGWDQDRGATVRSAVVHSDGTFEWVESLSLWNAFSSHVNIVMLDLWRFVSAARFLKIPALSPESSP